MAMDRICLTTSMHLTCFDSRLQKRVFESHASENIGRHTTRAQLLSELCAWIHDHTLFNEHSEFVSTAIHNTTNTGVFSTPTIPEFMSVGVQERHSSTHGINLVSSGGVSPLRVAVQSRLRGPNTEINLGHVNISTAIEPGTMACPAYTYTHNKSSLNTDIQAIHITCAKGDLDFTICAYVVPQRSHSVFAQSFLEVGGVCALLPKCSAMCLKNHIRRAKCESYRDHRVSCKQIHTDTMNKIQYPHGQRFPDIVLCNTDISVYSTRGPNNDALHTVFFK